MNPYLRQLAECAVRPHRVIAGLMSGTSLDGLDVALCRITGSGVETHVELLAFDTLPYDTTFKKGIREIFAKKDGGLELLCLLNPWVAEQHARMILHLLEKWEVPPADVDIIASHGQTVYHAPKRLHHHHAYGNATLQIGDGDHLAVHTGITTISDFRQKHIAAGGEGAPLAAYGDYLIFSSPNENRLMLNMGGIANFTWLPASMAAEEVFSTDTGPGNTLMDAVIQQQVPGRFFDENATLALQGRVHEQLLQTLLQHPFFKEAVPKTTGPEMFGLHYLQQAREASGTTDLPVADTMATLCRFSAETIAMLAAPLTGQPAKTVIYSSGGGMHNPLLMAHLRELLPAAAFKDTAALGINPDAKEAVLFAVLANECVCGGELYLGEGRNGIPNVTMGKISLPG